MQKTRITSSVLLAAVLCCSTGAFTSAQAEVLPDTAKFLPPETVGVFNIDNFSKLYEQLQKTDLYRLYKDPVMSPFVEDFKSKVLDKVREKRNRIAEVIVDTGILPEGRVALAFVLNPEAKDSKQPAFLLATQWGQNTAKIKEAVGKMVEKAVEEGSHKKSEDFRDVTIVTVIEKPSQSPDESSGNLENGNAAPTTTVEQPPKQVHYCFYDDCLFVAGDIDILKFAVAHIGGATSRNLDSSGDYTNAMKAAGAHHDADLYVNIKQMVQAGIAADSTGRTKAMLSNLGLDNVDSLAWSLGVGRLPGSSFNGKGLLKIEGSKKGVCKMLDAESAGLRVPTFVPASACSTMFFNLNIKTFYDELANILAKFSPRAASIMYMPLLPPGPDGQPGLQLKQDVINHLGSQIVVAQSINKPFAVGSKPTDTYIALAVNDRNALEKSLSLFHAKMIAPNKPDARRELLGHTIYLVDLSALLPAFLPAGRTPMQGPGVQPAGQMPTFAFTVTDTYLLFGTEATVEKAVRALSSSEAESLASAKWFTEAKSAIPASVGLASIKNDEVSTELSWWMLRQLKKDQPGSDQPGSGSVNVGMNSSFNLVLSQSGLDLFDFGLLPEFDAVRKYFGLSMFYGVSRPDGFFFEFRDLSRPE